MDRMNVKKIMLLLAAAGLLCSCGSVDEESSADSAAQTEAQTQSTVQADVDTGAAENTGDTQTTAELLAPDENAEPIAESVAAEDSPAEETEAAANIYENAEFGFSLTLPEGTFINEYEDESFYPLETDDEVQYRILVDSDYRDDFVMSAYFFQTEKTADELYENVLNVVAAALGDDLTAETISSEDFEASGHAAKIMILKSEGTGGIFYNIYSYFAVDGGYIFIYCSCADTGTMDTLTACLHTMQFE